jgi:hypothetical protein
MLFVLFNISGRSERVPDTIARPMFEGWVWRSVGGGGAHAAAADETLDAAAASGGGGANGAGASGGGQSTVTAGKRGAAAAGKTRANDDDDESAHSGEWAQRFAVLYLGVLYYFRDAEAAVVFRRLAARNESDAVIAAAPIAEGVSQEYVLLRA